MTHLVINLYINSEYYFTIQTLKALIQNFFFWEVYWVEAIFLFASALFKNIFKLLIMIITIFKNTYLIHKNTVTF